MAARPVRLPHVSMRDARAVYRRYTAKKPPKQEERIMYLGTRVRHQQSDPPRGGRIDDFRKVPVRTRHGLLALA